MSCLVYRRARELWFSHVSVCVCVSCVCLQVYESGARAMRGAGPYAGELPPADDAEARR